jgi:hypothetical protein
MNNTQLFYTWLSKQMHMYTEEQLITSKSEKKND